MKEIKDYITNDYKALDIESTISDAQDFSQEFTFSKFPVTENGIYIGSISNEDIEAYESEKKISDYRYSLEGFYTRINTNWLDVLEIFAKNRTDILPVLDDTNLYVGYYELVDIVKFFHETPFLKEAGGIIVVRKSIIDYSVSQIAQIIESSDGKLLGLFISDADLEYVEITLKINLGPMNEILQTFRRYNYEIISEHQEDSYINSLKERSDYLAKYLNI